MFKVKLNLIVSTIYSQQIVEECLQVPVPAFMVASEEISIGSKLSPIYCRGIEGERKIEIIFMLTKVIYVLYML